MNDDGTDLAPWQIIARRDPNFGFTTVRFKNHPDPRNSDLAIGSRAALASIRANLKTSLAEIRNEHGVFPALLIDWVESEGMPNWDPHFRLKRASQGHATLDSHLVRSQARGDECLIVPLASSYWIES